MPELPEVETVVRGLRRSIAGKTIQQVSILRPSVVEAESIKDFQRSLKGQQVDSVTRRAKYILMHFSKGHTLVTHLRMTGKYIVLPQPCPPDKHTRMVITFTDDSRLHYHDVRALGKLCLLGAGKSLPALDALGPEPLDEACTLEIFSAQLEAHNRELKDALMDQKILAGIGNIYASEICFKAGISPFKRTNTLTKKQFAALYQAMQLILNKAIELNGTTFSDYRDIEGAQGAFQNFLQVYGRENEPCRTCKTPITRTTQKQRSTFYCSRCQKA